MKIKNVPSTSAPREVATKLKIGKRRYTIHVVSEGGEIKQFQYKEHAFSVLRGDTLTALKQLESVLKVGDKKR